MEKLLLSSDFWRDSHLRNIDKEAKELDYLLIHIEIEMFFVFHPSFSSTIRIFHTPHSSFSTEPSSAGISGHKGEIIPCFFMWKRLAVLTHLTQDKLFSQNFRTFPTLTSQTCPSESTSFKLQFAFKLYCCITSLRDAITWGKRRPEHVQPTHRLLITNRLYLLWVLSG